MTNKRSKHDAVWEWLLECPLIQRLCFNFSEADDGDTAIIPSDTVLQEFVDGSERRRYAFELVRYLPYSTEDNDTGNIDMQMDVEGIAEWVEAQDAAGHFPVFPDGMTVEEVGALPDSAGYVAAQDGNRAKYMIPFKIDYIKE